MPAVISRRIRVGLACIAIISRIIYEFNPPSPSRNKNFLPQIHKHQISLHLHPHRMDLTGDNPFDLDGQEGTEASPFPKTPSATSSADNLRRRSLIKPNPPTNRRLSIGSPLKGAARKEGEGSCGPILPATPVPQGPVTRSGKKRRLVSDSTELGKKQRVKETMASKQQEDQTTGDKSILAVIEGLINGVRRDIADTERRTNAKLDSLSDGFTVRMENNEKEVKKMAKQLADSRKDVQDLRKQVEGDKEALPDLVRRMVRDTGSNPGGRAGPADSSGESKENKYWMARKSLKLWPVLEDDDGVLEVGRFLVERLKIPRTRVLQLSFSAKKLNVPPTIEAQNQVLVTFDSVRDRDEVKSAAKNLAGTDRTVGVHLDPPDHLRSHFQTFQAAAYQMKRKHKSLKRNVRFKDVELCLVMDFKIDGNADWRTIDVEAARTLVKHARSKTESLSKRDVENLVVVPADEDVCSITDSEADDEDFIDADDSNNSNKQTEKYPRFLTVINANARSLLPKIESLNDCFHEKRVDLACLTETWMQGNRLEDCIDEVKDRFSLGAIFRNRSNIAANGRQYGGVAFFYRTKTGSFDIFPFLNPDDHEILGTVGRVAGIKGQIVFFSCYAPPNLGQLRASALIEFVSDLVGEAKRRIQNCTVIVSGVFNQWPIEEILEDHPDLAEVNHGPTRGDRAIDRTFVNFGRSIVESGTSEPLETEEGNPSDHRVAYMKASFKTIKPKIKSYSYRVYTDDGAQRFKDKMSRQNWRAVYDATSTTSKAAALQKILDDSMNACFEWKTTRRRETDPPWMSDKIRKLCKKRRKIYDREGRSRTWKLLKAKTDRMKRYRVRMYLDGRKKALTGPQASKNFFKLVKAFKSKEKPPSFDVMELFPDATDGEAAESLATHFNTISNEFNGLDSPIPTSFSSPPPRLTREQVAKKLRKFKKPKSSVQGDIFPALINPTADWLAMPLQDIYNSISNSHEWPEGWKTEFVTPIPKKGLPQTPNDLRNISCTLHISKVYENFVLQWLAEFVSLRFNQYGGVKGCGKACQTMTGHPGGSGGSPSSLPSDFY